MTMGNRIAQYRKQMNITQDALAQKLGVSNQAVSKWESDQCCPDIALLPQLADIFQITIDQLFGRPAPTQTVCHDLPWPDGKDLHMVLYQGHKLISNCPTEQCSKLLFKYEGEALNVHSAISVECQNVQGDVDAGTMVNCGNVAGDVDAGTNVNCGNVDGSVDAGLSINCGNVGGSADAGQAICCADVEGDVDAGTSVTCQAVGGDVDAGSYVECGNVGGDIDAGSHVTCGEVHGDIDAGGSVTITKG